MATHSGALDGVVIFEYPAVPEETPFPAWGGWAADVVEDAEQRAEKAPVGEAVDAEFEHRLAEERRQSFEAGCERGRQEGRQAEREAQAAALASSESSRVRQAVELVESFTLERDRYLRNVEHEVVELALAVAARILRREAQMDPLLLTGAVRVALGQLSGSTQVRLRVPAAELDLWSEAVALLPSLAVKPTVLAGEEMRTGDCAIETELGSVDLGIRAQLAEIERGFFDRAGGAGNADATVSAGLESRP